MRSVSVKLHRLVFAAVLVLVCQPAWATKRVALVVGNSAYEKVERLTNPANDATAMAAKLKEAGFDLVDSRRDLSAAEMRRALRDFADQARDADVAVVYFAGHGIEVDGVNYLIPIDATLDRDTDVYDEAFSLDRVLLAVEPVKQLRLVILDACRGNPFKDMKRTVGLRDVNRGLARIEPSNTNTLIAFAAKAGSTAADGNTKNSPFTAALVKYIAVPGLDLRKAFGQVRDDVLRDSGNRQEPYVYGSLGGGDVALVPAMSVATPPANPPVDVRHDYELATQIGGREALNTFLVKYPDGFYASLAKLQLAKIAAEEDRVAATEKARVAAQERARLAADDSRKELQAKAAADAKAAEEARLAAEKVKQAAEAQAIEAEQTRAAAEWAAAHREAAAKALADTNSPARILADKMQAASAAVPPGQSIAASGQATGSKVVSGAPAPAVNLAALSAGPSPADLTKSVQSELRRVGCFTGAADGEWNSASRRSLTLFNRYAGTKFDVKLASVDTLDAIKLKTSRVCPLVCEHGYQADGDRCSKITCADGTFLNDDNECEKRREKKPVATRDDDRRDRGRSLREPPEPRRVIVRRAPEYGAAPSYARPPSSGAGIGASGQPLTGLERQQGCNGYGAIMSGRCP